MKIVPHCVSLPAQFHASPAEMTTARATRFEKALKFHMAAKGNQWNHNSPQCWLADMMADAFHWCDVNKVDSEFVLKLARSHHESEKLEDAMRLAKAPATENAALPH